VAGSLVLASTGALNASAVRAGTKEPTIALDAKLEAHAKAITIEPKDLPAGWATDPSWKRVSAITDQGSAFRCGGHAADLSTLVVRGTWSSRDVHVQGTAVEQVTSGVTFLATTRQARIEYRAAANLYPRYCSVPGTKGSSSVVKSVERLQLPPLGDEHVGFRTALAVTGAPFKTIWGDIVFVRRGSVFEQLLFVRTSEPFDASLERMLLQTFVARAHA